MAQREPVYTPSTKFTPELYQQYIKEPVWIVDGFTDKEEYESYWANVISQWLIQSKSKTEKWKSTCKDGWWEKKDLIVALKKKKLKFEIFDDK